VVAHKLKRTETATRQKARALGVKPVGSVKGKGGKTSDEIIPATARSVQGHSAVTRSAVGEVGKPIGRLVSGFGWGLRAGDRGRVLRSLDRGHERRVSPDGTGAFFVGCLHFIPRPGV
jgi:hypothetical protein